MLRSRVMAPIARQPRAGLTMDTVDMTFDAAGARALYADVPMTDVRTALRDAEAVRVRGAPPA